MTLLFGFELLSPAMLGWLVAAAAPILIHLWSRQRHREMTWAAMEYLLRALQASRRRLRFQEWFLLALRTSIIVLVVVAAADPLLENAVFVSARGERTHRVLVLDASFSMAYRSGKKTRFDRAKEIASQIVDESSQGDGFTLVLLSEPPRVVVGTPALDPRDFRKELEALEVLHGRANLPRTLAAVEETLAAARRDVPRLTREEVYFLTDLGRVGWSLEGLDQAGLDEFRKRSRRLADAARLVVIDLGQPGAENLAVADLRLAEPVAVAQEPVEIQAEVRYYGGSGGSSGDDADEEGIRDLRRRAAQG
ncbi:MAG: BatA domain-containing protein, partial [Thermoguttaceae bacterium]|nr:BatA domain-containing protein [Thermoguttaceae bacterium]